MLLGISMCSWRKSLSWPPIWMRPATIPNQVSSLASSWGAAKVMMAASWSTLICRRHGALSPWQRGADLMFFRSSWSSSIRRAIRTSYRLAHESVSGTFADLRVAQSGSSSWGTSVISCIILFAAGVWDAAPLEAELLVQTDRLVGGSDAVLVVDDTAIPRKGTHSVGVAAQYASALGK